MKQWLLSILAPQALRTDSNFARRAALACGMMDASADILRQTDDSESVQMLCDALVALSPELGLVWTWFGDPKAMNIAPQTFAGAAQEYARTLRIQRNALTEQGPVFRTIAGQRSEAFSVSSWSLYANWRKAAQTFGLRHVLAVPLAQSGSSQSGLMVFYAATPDYFHTMGVDLFEALGRMVGAVLHKQHQSQAFEAIAYHDSLTGLLNRNGFYSQLQKHAPNLPHHYGVCAMVDIDFFKRINDTYGHAAGDAVLQQMGQLIVRCLQAEQTAAQTVSSTTPHTTPPALCARWGGEEFLVFLPHRSLQGALDSLNALRQAIAAHDFVMSPTHTTHVTASMGLALCQSESQSFFQALEHADAALYRAKAAGRNCAVCY